MAKLLSKIATEYARRWIEANERRVKRGKERVAANWDDMREFCAFEDLDAAHLDIVADLATSKVIDYERRVAAGVAT